MTTNPEKMTTNPEDSLYEYPCNCGKGHWISDMECPHFQSGLLELTPPEASKADPAGEGIYYTIIRVETLYPRGPFLDNINVEEELKNFPPDCDEDTINIFRKFFKNGSHPHYRSVEHFLLEYYYAIDEKIICSEKQWDFKVTFITPCKWCTNSKLKNKDGKFQPINVIGRLEDFCLDCTKNQENTSP